MANSAQQKFLSHSVWTCVTQSPCAVSLGKFGDTWMRIGGHLFAVIALFRCAQKLMFSHRKGLNAQQTAFAVKKYKSHRRVGLPSEIIASMKQ
jgi:hypothetical protein